MSSDVTETFWVYEFWAWLQANRKTVLTVAAVLAVAGTAVGIVNHQRDEHELAANNALLSLELKKQGKASAGDYAGVAGQFQGTAVAERAMILGATALFKEGHYADAKTKFAEYQSSHPEGSFRSIAMLGIAASDDAANDLAKAETGYQQVISTFPNESVAAQAKLGLGLIMETKDPARAYKLYEEVSKIQGSAYASAGRLRLEQLTEIHPELKAKVTAAANTQLPIGIAAPKPAPKSK